MNKRLKLTETQFQKIKNFIFETKFDVLTRKSVKKGDYINVNTKSGVLEFEVIDSFGGQIYMKNINAGTMQFNKLVFVVPTSLQNNKLELKVANDAQANQKPFKPNTWVKSTVNNVESFDVIRDNKLVDSTDDSKEKEYVQPTPQTQPTQEPQPEPQTDLEQKITPEDKSNAYIAYDQILNDPILKNAFYKKPSFWNLFMSELKGKKATGKGIVPTLQLLDKYNFEKMKDMFIPGKKILFKALNNVEIYDNDNNLLFTFNDNNTYECTVNKLKINNKWVLENRTSNFKVNILYEMSDNIFVCELVKYYSDKTGAYKEFKTTKPVKIEILPSDGYNKKNKIN